MSPDEFEAVGPKALRAAAIRTRDKELCDLLTEEQGAALLAHVKEDSAEASRGRIALLNVEYVDYQDGHVNIYTVLYSGVIHFVCEESFAGKKTLKTTGQLVLSSLALFDRTNRHGKQTRFIK